VSIKTNFEFPRGDDPVKQGQRLAQDLSTNFKAIVNKLEKNSNTTSTSDGMPIGSVLHSMLTLAQIQSTYGTGWVLMDGSSCAGSSFATITGITTLPDATGRFLRGKNNGSGNNSAGEESLGAYEADQVTGTSIASGSGYAFLGSNSTSVGETRPRNITVNIFIKIN
jgi:hypothetical protein